MPRESIGDCGSAQYPDKDWITAELELGICYIRHACGEPPDGYELDITWHEHDLGEYATIDIVWDDYRDAPWEYISRAERALSRFDEAVSWSELHPETHDDDDDDEDDDYEEDEPEDDEDEDQGEGSIELYRRDEVIRVTEYDWGMALQIYSEMGWKPQRPLEAYARPLSFVPPAEAAGMEAAGRRLFALIHNEPIISTSVRMDLGTLHRLTDFLANGSCVVGEIGAYQQAIANGDLL